MPDLYSLEGPKNFCPFFAKKKHFAFIQVHIQNSVEIHGTIERKVNVLGLSKYVAAKTSKARPGETQNNKGIQACSNIGHKLPSNDRSTYLLRDSGLMDNCSELKSKPHKNRPF